MKTKQAIFLAASLLLITSLLAYYTKYKSPNTEKVNTVTGMANPASLNCEKQGGIIKIEKREDGAEYGLCYFDDGRACEEWAMMRGDCKVGGVKTTGYDTIDQKYCAWTGGKTTAEENSVCTFDNGVVCPTYEVYAGSCDMNTKDVIVYIKNDFYSIYARYVNDEKDTKKEVESFIKNLVSTKQSEWKIGGVMYNGEQQVNKDFPDRTPTKYSLNISYNKSDSQKLGTISYVYNTYEFTGGAHGNTDVNTFSFKENKKVNIDNILNLENKNDIEISKLIAQKILNNQDLKDYTSKDTVYDGLGLNYLNAKGEFDKAKCDCDGFFYGSNLKNFIVTDSGLTFIMDKYQVAAGAAGNPEIVLTWSELSGFINKSFDLPLD